VVFGPFLCLVVFQIIFPAVSASKPAVEEVVAFLAGNLEKDVAEAFSRGNGLMAFTANDLRLEFQGLPPGLSGPYLRYRKRNRKGDKELEDRRSLEENPVDGKSGFGAATESEVVDQPHIRL